MKNIGDNSRAGTGKVERERRATAFLSVGVDEQQQQYRGRAEVDWGGREARSLECSGSLSSLSHAFRCPKQGIDAERIRRQPCALPARPHQR